ncbi:MAG: insulinase family protein [Magnetococcales bacterium]|nr:insulinase family protein [Magnetococcales bacterium]
MSSALFAPAALPIPDPEYQLSTLPNGLLVATFAMPWLHEVGVTLVVRAGSRYESEAQAGIAHFLEHMLFKGTQTIPDPTALHSCLESMAADMNAATGQESNAYWITLPPRYLAEGLATFCEMFTQPALAGVETERQVILEEMREDENERGENINATTLSGELLWPGHPLARSVLGTPEAIVRIDVPALRAYLDHYYRGANMAIAFCGPVQHEACLALAERCLGGLPSGRREPTSPPPPMNPGPHWLAVDDQTSQFSLTLFFRTGGYQDPLFYHIAALRRLLDDGFSSRLHASLREQRGLVYDVWSAFTAHSDSGVLEVGASVSLDNLTTVFVALQEQLQWLCTNPPPPDEWQRLLTRWHANLITTLDRPAELIERYVSDRLFEAMEPLSVAWDRISQLDPRQLPAIAAQLTQATNQVVVLVGPNARKKLSLLQGRVGGRVVH